MLTILSMARGSDHTRGEEDRGGLVALQITAPEKLRFFLTSWRLSFLSVQKVGVLLVPGSENGQPLLSIPPCQGHSCPSSNHAALYGVGVPYQASDYSNEDSRTISVRTDSNLLQR